MRPEGQKVTAQEVNIIAAKEIANLVRSTLGPMGMDKMLVSMMAVSPLQMTVLRFSGRLTLPTQRLE